MVTTMNPTLYTPGNEATIEVLYRIRVIESERGWGQRSEYEYFETEREARSRICWINAQNTAPTAPDWYMQAEDEVIPIAKNKVHPRYWPKPKEEDKRSGLVSLV